MFQPNRAIAHKNELARSSRSMWWRNQFLPQHADVGKVAITFHEIEPVTDHKFVLDFKPDIICSDVPRPLFLFTEQHANTNAARSGRFQFLTNCCDCLAISQNVVENQNIPIDHIEERDLLENYLSARLRFSVIACHTQAMQFQRRGNPPQQVRHEYQASVQDRDNG